MKVRISWLRNKRVPVSPLVQATFETESEAAQFQLNFTPTGALVGSVTGRTLRFSGIYAKKFINDSGLLVPDCFKNWKLKQSSRRSALISDDELIADARKYQQRNEWRTKSRPNYQLAGRSKDLYAKCTAHMRRPVYPLKQYQVYAYEFADNVAYVGLTCNPTKRHIGHQEKGAVHDKMAAGWFPMFKELAGGLTPDQAVETERAKIVEYRQNGWTLLNKDAGGSLGQLRFKYDWDKLVEIASQCTSANDFRHKFNGPAQACAGYGWWEKLVAYGMANFRWPKPKYGRWATKYEECLESARAYTTVGDWMSFSPAMYRRATSRGWVKRIRAELNLKFKGKPKASCTWDELLVLASKVKSLKELKAAHFTLTRYADKLGWIDKLVEYGRAELGWPRPQGGRWEITYEECLNSARKCSTIREWWTRFPSFASKAKMAGWKKRIVIEAKLKPASRKF